MLNIARDHVDPPFVVPNSTVEPPSMTSPEEVFPACCGIASDPDAQHSLALAQLMPES
jgi:hypothetical protein